MYYCVVVKTDINLIATINFQLRSYTVIKNGNTLVCFVISNMTHNRVS